MKKVVVDGDGGIDSLFLEVDKVLFFPDVERVGQALPPGLDEGHVSELLESLCGHEATVSVVSVPDDVFPASGSGADSVGPSLDAIPERQRVVELADDLAAGTFNG